ncbi:HAMP domain-containing histidine kinase [Rhizobium sp. NZLR1b]|uniref:sensor histidine kinase n=1 Tax=unclassified Rhizobium TaxID=2613769 RepID=UPI001C83785B|nr:MULTISPECIES: HAMP domain-containing sensor histidine kinase [unclassified Rhizobium]MBX5173394.1 HAMP domain-containing histidine kinase [Rhizobium sp. NZLR1b]MBX5192538.1 HAMP domain-containing histidine kinase [Rhizobium sp. NZLR3b]
MRRSQPSLKARLIFRQLVLQFLAIAIAAIGLVVFFVNSTLDGMYADEGVAKVAANSIARDNHGAPIVGVTPEMAELQKESPDLWFGARLSDGSVITYGEVPPELASLVPHLDKLSSADIRGHVAPFRLSAVVRSVTGPAGEMKIIAHGRVQPFTVLITMASNVVAISIFLALALVSVIATPIIVKRALAAVTTVAEEAEQIDADRRGFRLSEDKIPREIGPLVRAFNGALGRLDDAFDRQRRFIASAAHELRTPIAILRMKIDAANEKGTRSLLPDVLRLANLSEQLLDIHRLDSGTPADRIDVSLMARNVAADLAPMLVASGKSIEVTIDKPGMMIGNAISIERALTNLIQNAVEHGGEQILVRVDGASFEVEDNGRGISKEEQLRIFEPFYRLRPRSAGAGLGLNLVKQVVDHHGGHINIATATSGGTIVRVGFPAIQDM